MIRYPIGYQWAQDGDFLPEFCWAKKPLTALGCLGCDPLYQHFYQDQMNKGQNAPASEFVCQLYSQEGCILSYDPIQDDTKWWYVPNTILILQCVDLHHQNRILETQYTSTQFLYIDIKIVFVRISIHLEWWIHMLDPMEKTAENHQVNLPKPLDPCQARSWVLWVLVDVFVASNVRLESWGLMIGYLMLLIFNLFMNIDDWKSWGWWINVNHGNLTIQNNDDLCGLHAFSWGYNGYCQWWLSGLSQPPIGCGFSMVFCHSLGQAEGEKNTMSVRSVADNSKELGVSRIFEIWVGERWW